MYKRKTISERLVQGDVVSLDPPVEAVISIFLHRIGTGHPGAVPHLVIGIICDPAQGIHAFAAVPLLVVLV